ncbi:hypothetical protein JL722_14500 [Aureococcus anophagefferens]|nr:hypothetical protein JL722_14500 [Aureococcus anophagefferens]
MSRFGDAPRTFDAVGKFDEPMLYVCPPRVKKGVIVRGDTPEDYMEKLKWSQTQDPGEVEIVMKLNPGTKKDEIDVLFNYRRLRVFVGEDCILDDVLYNPIICEGCTWTYNERNRKLEISLTKDSDTIV